MGTLAGAQGDERLLLERASGSIHLLGFGTHFD